MAKDNLKIIATGQRRQVSYNGWDQVRVQDNGIAPTHAVGTPEVVPKEYIDDLLDLGVQNFFTMYQSFGTTRWVANVVKDSVGKSSDGSDGGWYDYVGWSEGADARYGDKMPFRYGSPQIMKAYPGGLRQENTWSGYGPTEVWLGFFDGRWDYPGIGWDDTSALVWADLGWNFGARSDLNGGIRGGISYRDYAGVVVDFMVVSGGSRNSGPTAHHPYPAYSAIVTTNNLSLRINNVEYASIPQPSGIHLYGITSEYVTTNTWHYRWYIDGVLKHEQLNYVGGNVGDYGHLFVKNRHSRVTSTADYCPNTAHGGPTLNNTTDYNYYEVGPISIHNIALSAAQQLTLYNKWKL